HGKQNWYVQTGGIWQPVWFDVKPEVYILSVRVTAKMDGEVSVAAMLGGNATEDSYPVEVIVRNPRGEVEFRGQHSGLARPYGYNGKVRSPQLWSPANPALYTAEV